ncbi:hypothetical protein HAT91_00470 [Dickeya solani]|nr:hypothetical protein HAT91_00470 [Dickeya solani]
MLEPAQILAYITALGLAAAIPGPGMTALVARSVSGGAITGFTMLAGLIIGDLIYLSFAVFGLAVVAHSYGALFTLISWGLQFTLAGFPGSSGAITRRLSLSIKESAGVSWLPPGSLA